LNNDKTIKKMSSNELKYSKKGLLIRGFVTFLFIGILYSIIQDKKILSYFLQAKILFQILFFTLLGGIISSGVNYLFIKKYNKKRKTIHD
jgi:hypothetical protein